MSPPVSFCPPTELDPRSSLCSPALLRYFAYLIAVQLPMTPLLLDLLHIFEKLLVYSHDLRDEYNRNDRSDYHFHWPLLFPLIPSRLTREQSRRMCPGLATFRRKIWFTRKAEFSDVSGPAATYITSEISSVTTFRHSNPTRGVSPVLSLPAADRC